MSARFRIDHCIGRTDGGLPKSTLPCSEDVRQVPTTAWICRMSFLSSGDIIYAPLRPPSAIYPATRWYQNDDGGALYIATRGTGVDSWARINNT